MSDPFKGEQPPAYTPAPQGYGAQPAPQAYPGVQGYQGYQTGAPPGYQQVTGAPPAGYIPAQPIRVTSTNVVVVGGCPACRIGILEDDFTLLGVCCAILFFPLGILCCLAMRQRRCPNCGAVFG
ncbi:brain protein I3-like [Patiria miniata]|uniref:Membrane protein BRI3 n=1 Tax=Patiria miniata TaxID=46514 RepID=A0A914AYC7_PATMI|nr:brain protein I3-like [Patiria miniata]XP_038069151.1 brain protein I3-like [Patiria miniata]